MELDSFCFGVLFVCVSPRTAYGRVWMGSAAWMAIISLGWLNCVTDLVAPSKKCSEQFRSRYCARGANQECCRNIGGNGSSLTTCGIGKTGGGLKGGVVRSGFCAQVIRKGSVKFRNDLFCVLRADHARLCHLFSPRGYLLFYDGFVLKVLGFHFPDIIILLLPLFLDSTPPPCQTPSKPVRGLVFFSFVKT